VGGHTNDFTLEAGYIMNVNDRFKLVPHIGYIYGITHSKIRHQKEFHGNPSSFVSQNGNKTDDTLWFPYIGLELDFNYKLCGCYDIQLTTNYEFGYGGGHSNTSVPHFIATDDPNTSRYGNHVKYRNMVSHDFEIGAAYNLSDAWLLGVTIDYINIYNTSKLPVKLQRNQDLVAAGQFTPTQYHRINDYTSQTYAITFSLVYSFSGKGGVWIR
jgi:hypothetical protein